VSRWFSSRSSRRVNPALAGIIPENSAGFGDIEKIDRVYTNNEIRPICQLFNQLNDTLRKDRRFSWKNKEKEVDSTTSST